MLWIGVDDTDSLHGMCTTFLATEIVRELTQGYDLIGYPRLVRLNPNIPWKTRGNGAVCIRIGRGIGPARRMGEIAGKEILSYPRSRSAEDPDGVVQNVAALVERWSHFDDPTTNPGFAVLQRPGPPRLYWKGVRGILSRGEILRAVRGSGVVRGYKDGRGVIGAVTATAWRPQDRTYEVLTYRDPSKWGTSREIDPDSVREMDRAFPSTFNNYDGENRRIVIAPHSPCPVLFGIRGDDPGDLPAAMERIRGERSERWLLFETNQGTDDHVRPGRSIEPWTTVRVRGRITAPPRNLPGGHVVFRVRGIDVTAYEPSKQFRAVVRRLVEGDRVEAIGAVRDSPRTVNLEKLRVLFLVPMRRKVANPWCVSCEKRAKSLGHRAGFRCVRCRRKFPESAAVFEQIPRGLEIGWYEPPVGSRRHLSKPIIRLCRTKPSQSGRPSLDPEARNAVSPLHVLYDL